MRLLITLISLALLITKSAEAAVGLNVQYARSPDIQFCRSVANLYERLINQRNSTVFENFEGIRLSKNLDLETDHEKDFQRIELTHIEPIQNLNISWDGFKKPLVVGLYPLLSSKQDQIYLADYPIGSHGYFGTQVWVIKSLDNYIKLTEESPWLIPSDIKDENIEASVFTRDGLSLENDKKMFSINKKQNLKIEDGILQRVFNYKNNTILIARDLANSDVILYEFSNKRLNTICKISAYKIATP